MKLFLILKKRNPNVKLHKNRRILQNKKARNGLYLTHQKHRKHLYQIDSGKVQRKCYAKTLFDFTDCPNHCEANNCFYCPYHLRIKDLLMFRLQYTEYVMKRLTIRDAMEDFVLYTKTYWEKIFPSAKEPPFNIDDTFWTDCRRVRGTGNAGTCPVINFDNVKATCGRVVNDADLTCKYHHNMATCMYDFYHFKEGNPIYPDDTVLLTKDGVFGVIDKIGPGWQALRERLLEVPFNVAYYLEFFLRLEYIIVTQVEVDKPHVKACFVLLRKAKRKINSYNYKKNFEFLTRAVFDRHMKKLQRYCGPWFNAYLRELYEDPENNPQPD